MNVSAGVSPSPNMSAQLQKTKKLELFQKKSTILSHVFTGSGLELQRGNHVVMFFFVEAGTDRGGF